MDLDLLNDGPGLGAHVFVCAHGSGTAYDQSPMPEFAAGLANLGVDVVRFEFPYMRARRADGVHRAPDPDDVLAAHFARVVAEVAAEVRGAGALVVGGWSRGGRIAAQLAANADAAGLVCLSYPFHPIGAPTELAAAASLRRVQLPTLVVQGSRDAFGNREQVRGYELGEHVRVHWLDDANHALRPRARSGLSAEGHLREAITQVAGFILAL